MKLIGIIAGFIALAFARNKGVSLDAFYLMLAVLIAGFMAGDSD